MSVLLGIAAVLLVVVGGPAVALFLAAFLTPPWDGRDD